MKSISQSFIKSYGKYLRGEECGHLINWMWVLGKLLPPTPAMHVGTYFEFCLTGALPKNNEIPRPKFIKSGDMAVEYRKAARAAKYVKELLIGMGLMIDKSGQTIHKGRFSGTIDIIVIATKDLVLGGFEIKDGEKFVIDLKYSGLLEDWKSEHGWMFSDKQKEHHAVQAIHYHMVSGLRFFYLVTDSAHKEKDDDENYILPALKFFHTPIDQFMIDQHINKANDLYENFQLQESLGAFMPHPKFERCNKCPLRSDCNDKALFPGVQVIDLNID